MNKSRGAIALVGSGEYLPVMQELESQLLRIAVARGKKNTFVQIPTAAGRESRESIKFWKERGEIQVARIGAQSIFIPVLTREDAFNEDFITLIEDAGLIYFSGGDPGYLAQVFSGTPLWGAIVKAWHDGSSLAGCSAGAMAFGEKIVGIRLTHAINGLGLLPDIEVIPHFDKFLGWVPEKITAAIMRPDAGTKLIGIDENTALICTDRWRVFGEGGVHILRGIIAAPKTFRAGETVDI